MTTTPQVLAYDVDSAAEACSVSRDTILRSIRSGALRAKRTGARGGKYVITPAALQRWLDSLGDA